MYPLRPSGPTRLSASGVCSSHASAADFGSEGPRHLCKRSEPFPRSLGELDASACRAACARLGVRARAASVGRGMAEYHVNRIGSRRQHETRRGFTLNPANRAMAVFKTRHRSQHENPSLPGPLIQTQIGAGRPTQRHIVIATRPVHVVSLRCSRHTAAVLGLTLNRGRKLSCVVRQQVLFSAAASSAHRRSQRQDHLLVSV